MPTKKTEDELVDQIMRSQKEQELEAKAKEMRDAQRDRLEDAKERIRARGTKTKTYTVQAGDTLGKIAAKFYEDGERWTEIYEANKAKIPDPNVIQVGQVLVIP
jgi:nucleoid-associated protein YgaU